MPDADALTAEVVLAALKATGRLAADELLVGRVSPLIYGIAIEAVGAALEAVLERLRVRSVEIEVSPGARATATIDWGEDPGSAS